MQFEGPARGQCCSHWGRSSLLSNPFQNHPYRHTEKYIVTLKHTKVTARIDHHSSKFRFVWHQCQYLWPVYCLSFKCSVFCLSTSRWSKKLASAAWGLCCFWPAGPICFLSYVSRFLLRKRPKCRSPRVGWGDKAENGKSMISSSTRLPHICNPGTHELEAGWRGVQGHFQLHTELEGSRDHMRGWLKRETKILAHYKRQTET